MEALRRSQAQEQRGAEAYGGRRQPGSGSGPLHKADVVTPATVEPDGVSQCIEYKRTDKRQMVLHLADLERLRRQALSRGRRAMLGIEIGGRDYVLRPVEDDLEREQRIADLERRLREGSGADSALLGGQPAPAADAGLEMPRNPLLRGVVRSRP